MTERYAIWDDTDTQRSGRFDWMLDQTELPNLRPMGGSTADAVFVS